MIPFCETWYCCISSWYWLILISGHLVLYTTVAQWYYLSLHYPSDNVLTFILVTLLGSWIFSIWLPFVMILIRTERKELPTAVIFCVGCLLPIICATVSLALTFVYPVSSNGYYKHMLGQLQTDIIEQQEKQGNGDYSDNEIWIDHVQKRKGCCGLKNSLDYSFLKNGPRIPISCLKDPELNTRSFTNKTTKRHGCLPFLKTTRDWYLLILRICDAWLILGSLITLIIYSYGFWWVQKLPMVVLTGKVYIRTANSGIKSYPEIDSSEAVSYSSSN